MTLRLVVQTTLLLAYILLASFVILNAETRRRRGFIFLEFFGRLRESKTLARFEGANGSLCNRKQIIHSLPPHELTRRMVSPTLGRKALSEEVQNPLRTRSRSNGAKAECVWPRLGFCTDE